MPAFETTGVPEHAVVEVVRVDDGELIWVPAALYLTERGEWRVAGLSRDEAIKFDSEDGAERLKRLCQSGHWVVIFYHVEDFWEELVEADGGECLGKVDGRAGLLVWINGKEGQGFVLRDTDERRFKFTIGAVEGDSVRPTLIAEALKA